jgi:hypothetical protein
LYQKVQKAFSTYTAQDIFGYTFLGPQSRFPRYVSALRSLNGNLFQSLGHVVLMVRLINSVELTLENSNTLVAIEL